MRAILKPARIWVGSRRWVRLRTTSRNSCDVGTGAMSVHVYKPRQGNTSAQVSSRNWDDTLELARGHAQRTVFMMTKTVVRPSSSLTVHDRAASFFGNLSLSSTKILDESTANCAGGGGERLFSEKHRADKRASAVTCSGGGAPANAQTACLRTVIRTLRTEVKQLNLVVAVWIYGHSASFYQEKLSNSR